MKKLLLTAATVLTFASVPAFAADHGGDHGGRGGAVAGHVGGGGPRGWDRGWGGHVGYGPRYWGYGYPLYAYDYPPPYIYPSPVYPRYGYAPVGPNISLGFSARR